MKKTIEIELQENELDNAQQVGLQCIIQSIVNVMQTKCFLHPTKVYVDGSIAWTKEKK